MKKNMILFNLVLLAVSVVLAQKLRSDWARFQIDNNLAHLKPAKGTTAPASPSAGQPVGVTNYSTIVDKHLFAQDRNNIIPPEPSPEERAKPLAPKPLLMGIMDLGEEQFAWMMSSDPKEGKDYRKVRIGDSLGEYQLSQILDQKVIMSANGEKVEVRLNEPSKVVARDVAGSAGESQKVANVGSGSTTAAGSSQSPAASSSSRQNNPEAVPAGTVVNGRRKVVVPSPFGPMTSWVEVK